MVTARSQSNPFQDASFLSKCFFLWAWPLLNAGRRKPLTEDDLYEVLHSDSSEEGLRRMKSNYESGKSTRSLFSILAIDYYKTMILAQGLLVSSMTARIVQAIALGNLLDQFQDDSTASLQEGCLWTGVIIVCGMVIFLCKQRQFFETYHKGMQMKIGLVAMIFDKSLRLPADVHARAVEDDASQSTDGEARPRSLGNAGNLASNDVERFIHASVMGIYLPWGPVEAIAILIIGLRILGPAFASGYVFLAAFLCLQTYLSGRFAKVRGEVAECTDSRAAMMAQAIHGARVMKMNAWETEFERRISRFRSNELDTIHRSSRLKALNEAAYFVSSLVVSAIVFAVHVAIGGTLTSRNVFSSMALFNILQFTMTKIFANAVMSVSECHTSCARIDTFLRKPEKVQAEAAGNGKCDCVGSAEIITDASDAKHADEHSTSGDNDASDEHPTICKLNNVASVWSNTKLPAIRNVDIEFTRGSVYCVVGRVGAGKTGLLDTIAGENEITKGTMIQSGSPTMAFAPQDAWIMNGTVRENVLMGCAYDETWYNEIIHACSLRTDLQQFADGDATMLGDKGLRCSGGQRSRISLARALYRDTDILVLDDPFSAVDAKVGRWLKEHAIESIALTRNKCIIIATHQYHLFPSATFIVMQDGAVAAKGTLVECANAVDGVLDQHNGTRSTSDNTSEDQSDSQDTHNDDVDTASAANTTATTALDEDKEGPSKLVSAPATPTAAPEAATPTLSKQDTATVLKEGRSTGVLKSETWSRYANAMGGVWVPILLATVFAGTQVSSLVSIVQLGKWADASEEAQDSDEWLRSIFLLVLSTILLAIARAVISFYFCIRASSHLHQSMVRSVLRAEITFFDVNPSGRIINRFAADTGVADEVLPLTIYDFLVGCFMALGGVVTAITVLPLIFVAMPPIVWFFLHIRTIFVTNTREIKRMEGLARSPIFEMLAESAQGIKTIQCNGSVAYFEDRFREAQDAHTRAAFAFVAASRWFATRVEYTTWFLLTMGTSLSVLFNHYGWFNVSPAVLGLALTLLLQLAGTNLPWIVRQSAEVVNQMISVERMVEYTDIPSEAELKTEVDDKLQDWPQRPTIVASNLSVRYRPDLPLVLSDVDFTLESGTWCGVVGRTGSGKSTAVQCLLRLLECCDGRIEIDGVDIRSLGLHKLRLATSVLPQTPILFDGVSIRENLDPIGACDDDLVWSALEDVQMASVIRDLPGRLSCTSTSFSTGQKQLLCLARAILRKSSILILDEATANVDLHTEELLRVALQKRFQNSTILAIAHRLDTVIDYDQIIVIDAGKILETGSPEELLSSEDGAFTSMVDQCGEEAAKMLKAKARERATTDKSVP